jgi:putative peptidoglycan lipid II flippase
VSVGRQVARATGLIIFITLVSKVTGFSRTVVQAYAFGANCQTDAFVAATVYPSLLFAGINGAITTTFIPLYTEIKERRGREAAIQYTNTLFTVLFAALIILEVVGIVLAGVIQPLYLPGWVGQYCGGEPKLLLTLQLTWVMLPALIFMGLSGVQAGILQAENDFAWPAGIGIPQNFLFIAAILLMEQHYGIFAAAVGTLVGGVSYVIWLAIPLRTRHGYRYQMRFTLQDPELRRMGRMVIPVFLSTFVGQAGYIVDRILATSLKAGSVTALQYSSLVNNTVLGLFVTALVTALYPTLSRYIAQQDVAGFVAANRRSLALLTVVTMPITIGVIVLRTPLIAAIYQRGAFTSAATGATAFALAYFSVGLVALAYTSLLPRAFFALQDTRTPTTYGMVAVAVNIVADLLLVHPLRQGGLALGTSIAQWALAAFLLVQLRRRIGPLGGGRLALTFAKSLVASVVMGVTVWALFRYTLRLVPPHATLLGITHLFVIMLVGAGLYGTLVWFFRIEEVGYLLTLLREGYRRISPSTRPLA